MRKPLQILAAIALSLAATPVYAQDAEVTTVLSADFTVFTEGTPQEPVSIPSYGTGSFTSYFTGWSASSVAQAGGSLMINDGGSVRTSYNNLSANGGSFKVKFEARAMDDYGGIMTVKVGYSTSENIFLSDQWETKEVILSGGTSYSAVTIAPFLSASGVLVKSLVIEQSEAFVAAPVAYQPNGATATSFTASWKKVTAATGYLLDVYSYAADGTTREYFLQNEDCGTSTSRKVEGLDPAKQYYYVVRATTDKGVSADSNEIEVVVYISSIAAPEISATWTDANYKLDWQPVENALGYEVSIYKHITLAEAGETDIIAEDFSLVNLGTFQSVDFNVGNLDKWTSTPGWDGPVTSLALANGMMVLDNWGSDRYIATPEIDLSADNGNCTVRINLAQALMGTYADGGKVNVAIVTFTAGDADYTVVDSKDITIDAKEFKEYEVTLSGGTSVCRVKVTADDALTDRIYIDDISVTQNLPAGSVQRKLLSTERCTDNTYSGSYVKEDNTQYSATVATVGRTVFSGEIVELLSDPSNEVYFGSQSGIAAVGADTDTAAPVEYFDLSGRRVANPSAGLYIRRQGASVEKVILR